MSQPSPRTWNEAIPPAGAVASLFELTALLSRALDVEEISRLVATHGRTAVGADAGFVAVRTADGTALEMLAHSRSDVQGPARRCRLGLDQHLPVVESYRGAVPVLVGDRASLLERYPDLDPRRDRAAIAAVPLQVDGVVLGAMNLTFSVAQAFDYRHQVALDALASLCAQALRRAELTAQVEQRRREFVATVSHELRTPLATIYGAAVTLQRAEVPLGADARDQLIGLIATQATRMGSVIDDLRLTSEIDGAHLELNLAATDVAEVVDHATAFWTRQHDTPVTVVHTRKDVGPVIADPVRLQQVIANLVDNAVKYGGSQPVVVTLTAVDDRVVVRVRDHGPGLPDEELDRVFEQFHRTDPHHRRNVGGAGLGLYICRHLVEGMGGRISLAAAADGSGLQASVDLPRATLT